MQKCIILLPLLFFSTFATFLDNGEDNIPFKNFDDIPHHHPFFGNPNHFFGKGNPFFAYQVGNVQGSLNGDQSDSAGFPEFDSGTNNDDVSRSTFNPNPRGNYEYPGQDVTNPGIENNNGEEEKQPADKYEYPGQDMSNPGIEIIIKPDFETNYEGLWKVDSENAGVSAMQLQLMPNNKVVWFDTTALGDSALHLNPPGNCPHNIEKNYADCYAHGVAYDAETAEIRPLRMESDTWCSSGGLSAKGNLINTGGANKGIRAVRILEPCDDCEFKDQQNALSADRWYPSTQILEDGTFAVVGGRRAYNYDIIPPDTLKFPIQQFGLRFLADTTDPAENNLYPFLILIPDGNLFLFANNRAIILEPKTGKTLREIPVLPGGSRNYPASGSASLLPIKLTTDSNAPVEAEILICGGNTADAFTAADGKPDNEKKFLPALKDCGRIVITKEDAQWDIEEMPSPRVMGDMLILPTGDLLLINGAKKGTSGWFDADEPNFTPAIYNPKKNKGERFRELKPTQIPRMYHSSSAVLPDGNVLIAGSNPNDKYNFQSKYPTELRVEKFSPPYLDPALEQHRPKILERKSDNKLKYGEKFVIRFKVKDAPQLAASDVKLTMLAPPFTTHGYSQNQRMLVLGLFEVINKKITAVAPPSGKLAPPGYYMMFVVYRGVPSKGMWVHIE